VNAACLATHTETYILNIDGRLSSEWVTHVWRQNSAAGHAATSALIIRHQDIYLSDPSEACSWVITSCQSPATVQYDISYWRRVTTLTSEKSCRVLHATYTDDYSQVMTESCAIWQSWLIVDDTAYRPESALCGSF